ncbi:MAG: NlpC/P60 family protein [Gammaproteobacteria bacterium]|jgi:cell wall-associated NlpC family hydrolase|nr:NlpC/P60 family protein [Gammaproteobacteria bacterium]
MKKLVTVFVYAMILIACSSAPYHDSKNPSVKVSTVRVDLSNTHQVKQILNQQYNDWHHVSYRMGGLSKMGIDCSGLVYRTYREEFGISMPRSTDSQAGIGRVIKRNQLRAGDIVFFKTGLFSRHVGIYIANDNFLHVSATRGVMISSLDNRYWRDTYWQSRRVQ